MKINPIQMTTIESVDSKIQIIKLESIDDSGNLATLYKFITTNKSGVNIMAEFKFHKGDRVAWFSPEGQVIGTIEKVFKDKCWLQPAGTDRIGDPVIKGVSLDAIELYSGEPGPIEVAIAQAETDNCQPQQLSEWKIGDRIGFCDLEYGDSDFIEGEIIHIDFDAEVVGIKSDDGVCYANIPFGWLDLPSAGKNALVENAIAEPEPETFWLPITAIAETPIFQPRGSEYQPEDSKGIADDVVEQYAEWLEFSEPPPIEVWFGVIGNRCEHWLLAGHHRIRALKKAGRENVECFFKATNYEEAVYRASISNAGDSRSRQLYKMRRHEWGEACKQFLRVCDRLSEEAIQEFLDRAAALTGQSTKWSQLNNSAIAAVFGVSRSSVISYRKTIELERAMEPFQKGDRVVLIDFQDYIHIANQHKYRIGTVVRKHSNTGISVLFDYHRIPEGNFLPEQLKIVDEPPFERPAFKVGDCVWKDGDLGVVLAIEDPENKYEGMEWGIWSVNCENSLIWWDKGIHTVEANRRLDLEPETAEIPTVEFRIGKMWDYLAEIEKDDDLEDYQKQSLIDSLTKQIAALDPDNCQPQQLSADTKPTSVNHEVAAKREELLGRSRPAGSNGAELPEPKDPGEDPETIARERPEETRDLSVAQYEARRSAALNRYNDLMFDLEVLPDDDLEELIKSAQAELDRRDRSQREDIPTRRLEIA